MVLAFGSPEACGEYSRDGLFSLSPLDELKRFVPIFVLQASAILLAVFEPEPPESSSWARVILLGSSPASSASLRPSGMIYNGARKPQNDVSII